MSKDRDLRHSANLSAVVLERPADPPEPTWQEKYEELERAHLMRDNLLAHRLDYLHTAIVKQGRTFEKIRDLHVETRDAMRDLAKPDPVQQAILDELRGMREVSKDIASYLATLVEMNSNGHGTSH